MHAEAKKRQASGAKSGAWMAFAVFLLLAISCGGGFAPSSQVDSLRILDVTTSPSYAAPGQKVTFSMTAVDRLAETGRDLQVVWLGGCTNPVGDQYYGCYPQLGELFAGLSSGEPTDLLSIQSISAADSEAGTLQASSFEWTLPDDLVSSRPSPEVGPKYGIAYVFFAVCAGTLAPATITTEGSAPAFPLVCLDDDGNRLGAESFVPGYTQVYAFDDERTNASPGIDELTLDGEALTDSSDGIIEVTTCPVPVADRDEMESGCGDVPLEERCTPHELKALVGDVAEVIPADGSESSESLKETIWVEYFADGGSLKESLKLVSDAQSGFIGEQQTTWFAPLETGTFNLWAVARDQRGGASIVRRTVRVVAQTP